VNYLIVDGSVYKKYTSPLVENYPVLWKRVYFDSVASDSTEEPRDKFEIYERVDPQLPLPRRDLTAHP
jgi:hypothetical protein